ncbi:DUF4393 domain-containing protein [Enterococcus dispar]|uniref:DUF4393 domain-containing protein n=1 Tax=Enterococcus dispar TaxID=44009 RepID=UPI00189EA542|nr:DUF4393 domain-containing protein [Enterococcus dispar]
MTGNDSYSTDITKAIETAKELINVIPEESRKELLNPIAKSAGRGSSSILNIITYPFNSLNLTLENRLTEKAAILEKKTEEKIKIIEEKGSYTDVNAGMAIKAIENSRYSLDSEILREYFSELIANSFDADKSDQLSPIFATILSNMSENDALFLRKLKNSNDPDSIAITTLVYVDEQGNNYKFKKDLLLWDINHIEESGPTLNVLESFGLITITRDRWWTSGNYPEIYNSVENNIWFISAKEQLNTRFKSVTHKDGYIEVSPLGKSFIDMVVV